MAAVAARRAEVARPSLTGNHAYGHERVSAEQQES